MKDRYIPEHVFWVVSLYMRTMIPRKWTASEAMKKWLWFLTQNFKATKPHSASEAPRKILTFIDCLLTHWNRTFTEVFLLLPMEPAVHPNLTRSMPREKTRERKLWWNFEWENKQKQKSVFCFGLCLFGDQREYERFDGQLGMQLVAYYVAFMLLACEDQWEMDTLNVN